MTVAAGTWNIALVTANTHSSGGLIQPMRSAAREDLKMWETRTSGGVLPSMPELCTANIDGQLVIGGRIIRFQELLYCHERGYGKGGYCGCGWIGRERDA